MTALALVWITSARANPTQDCLALQARLDGQLRGASAVTAREDTDTDLPGPDILDELRACEQHAGPEALPHSVWLESDRKAGREALGLSAADILVVPAQVQGLGLDPINRSLMSSDLGWALGQHFKVADPRAVQRALGAGRRYSTSDVDDLAQVLHASKIVLLYAGHDLQKHMVITVQLRKPGQATAVWQKNWRGVQFSDSQPPALVFHRMLPEIIGALPVASQGGAAQIAPASRTSGNPPPVGKLDASKLGATLSASEAMALLGTLAGDNDSGHKAQLLERALVASWYLDPDLRRARWLRAYLLMCLDHRPAALALLAGDTTAAGQTLSALLNGNLPATKAGLAKVTEPYPRLLLSLKAGDLARRYGDKPFVTPRATADVFGASYLRWASVVLMRAAAVDPLQVPAAFEVKQLLDAAFPIPEYSAEIVLGRNHVAPEKFPDEVSVDLASWHHMSLITRELQAVACCSMRPDPSDVLEMIQSQWESRIHESIYLQAIIQGRAIDAVRQIERYEQELEGHPVITLAHAMAAVQLVIASDKTANAHWSSIAASTATLAAWLPQGQTRLSWSALGCMESPPLGLGLLLLKAYSLDYPQHAYWLPMQKALTWFPINPAKPAEYPAQMAREQRLALALARESASYSTDSMDPLFVLSRMLAGPDLQDLMSGLGDRFLGNPDRAQLIKTSRGGGPEAKQDEELMSLEENVDQGTHDFFSYLQLGDARIRLTGDYAGAARDYLRYPGFHDHASIDPVSRSNDALMAATRLYLLGQAELAKPLLRISAQSGSGSEAEFVSAMLLQLLAGNYEQALATARDRVGRYQSANGYGDYLSLLHVTGFASEAWRAFSGIEYTSDDPGAWNSALIGHRLEGADDAALRRWLLQPFVRDAHFGGRHFAPWFAVNWYTTDRTPPAGIGALIDQLEGANAPRISADGIHLQRPGLRDPDALELVELSPLRVGNPPKLPPGTVASSEYAMFLEGYAALKRGQFPEALRAFTDMAARYPIELQGTERALGYALPYFAYAAARNHDPHGSEKLISQLQAGTVFDRSLAQAFFAAMHGDADAADKALTTAFRQKYFAVAGKFGARPTQIDYQYAEACEWLFQFTGDKRFEAKLLDWALEVENSAPIAAWPYAIEYQYSTDAQKKLRALAMALYLDPRSERISSAAPADRARARQWFEHNNPFKPVERMKDGLRPEDVQL